MKRISVHIQRIIVCHKIEQMDTKGRIMKHSVPPVASHDTPTSLFRHSHSFNTFSYTTNLIHLKMIKKKIKLSWLELIENFSDLKNS